MHYRVRLSGPNSLEQDVSSCTSSLIAFNAKGGIAAYKESGICTFQNRARGPASEHMLHTNYDAKLVESA